MQEPIRYRNRIPFYYDKSKEEFLQDPYERYDTMVVRQSILHLADDQWLSYPFQTVKDYIESNWPSSDPENILEIGCGVGRMIGDIAAQFPDSNCWGIDYSYQMLKCAHEMWIDGEEIVLDLSRSGFEDSVTLEGNMISNLNFGLAKCEALPFADASQDLVISSFLLDRLSDPLNGLKEMKRVLRKDGKIVIVTPLNFNTRKNWNQFFPASKLRKVIENMGFDVWDWKDDIIVQEPIDRRGNKVVWNCLGIVLK